MIPELRHFRFVLLLLALQLADLIARPFVQNLQLLQLNAQALVFAQQTLLRTEIVLLIEQRRTGGAVRLQINAL